MEDANPRPRTVQSEELFESANVVLIEHEGAVYRLIRTRQGKLVLNK